MTAPPLSAEAVRRAVMEPTCPKHGSETMGKPPSCGCPPENIWPALFTRIPDCRPERLTSDPVWRIRGEQPGSSMQITTAHATALILQQIAQSGTQAYRTMPVSARPAGSEYLKLTLAIMSGNPPDAVAARQRLKDLEEA